MTAVAYDDRAIVLNTIAQFYELNYPDLESCPQEIQERISSFVITAYCVPEKHVTATLSGNIRAANLRFYSETQGDPLSLINPKSYSQSRYANNQKFYSVAEAIVENTKGHHLAFFERDSLQRVVSAELFDRLPLPLIRSLYADRIKLGHNAEAVVDFSEWFQSCMHEKDFLVRSMDYLLEIGEDFSQSWWNADPTKDFYLSSHYYSKQISEYIETSKEALKAACKQSPYEIYHELSYALYDVLFALATEGLFPLGSDAERLRRYVVDKATTMREKETKLLGRPA